MKKNELVSAIAEKAGVTKKDANAMLDAFLSTVEEELVKGEKVTLVGFGTFEMKTRAARTGRNPQTGAAMKIAASSTLAFKPSSTFKTVVKPAKKACAKKSCKKK